MFGAAALLEFLATVEGTSCWVELCAVTVYVLLQLGELVLEIEQSLEDGFQVSPVILPVPLPLDFHTVDMFVEDLPRGGRVAVSFVLVRH